MSGSAMLVGAAKLPGVRINREAYLRSALARHCSEDDIRRAVEESPAAAGITVEVLDKAANDSIRFETGKVSALSAAAGLPGIIALPAAVPADVAQYIGHMLRIAQKLAYLYSWPDLLTDEGDDVDDATMGVLTLFFGVMFGTQSANAAVGKVAGMMSEQVAKKLPQKAPAQGVIYPIAKKGRGLPGRRDDKAVLREDRLEGHPSHRGRRLRRTDSYDLPSDGQETQEAPLQLGADETVPPSCRCGWRSRGRPLTFRHSAR
ncbi:hypothetical protein M2283_003953 [Streptomyces pseudovenezuelae]|uniref:Uncharacterized protein n=1 Tax=Streptomyces pseudovenezuelae TaxID=67350 RepID=A0ABT6LK06_9ACTN|nr:hypothetical protein [Streptomyces pseudovenezuelae]